MPAPPRMARSLGTRPRPSRARAGLIQATPLVGTFRAVDADNSAQTIYSWCPPGQTFNPATLDCEGVILPSGIEPVITGAPPDFSWMDDDDDADTGTDAATIPPPPQPREQDFPWGILAAGLVAVVFIGRR